MKKLDSIPVGSNQAIELWAGDLASPSAPEADLLVVSAFPDDYLPIRGTLIGALHEQDLSLEVLARDKEEDLREHFSCWLSRPVDSSLPYKRILCFEPQVRGPATEVVGDIFRSIAPFAHTVPSSSLAMPLVAAGSQGEAPEEILEALLEAGLKWMRPGFPVETLRIFVYSEETQERVANVFRSQKPSRAEADAGPAANQPEFDLFVSYSSSNASEADALVDEVSQTDSGLNVFLDRTKLKPGMSWQREIFEAIDASNHFVALFSPEYLASKVCQQEYEVALMRDRELPRGFLLPVYLYTTELPTFMRLVHHQDCREGNLDRVRSVARSLASELMGA